MNRRTPFAEWWAALPIDDRLKHLHHEEAWNAGVATERAREKVEAMHREAENLVDGLFRTGKTASILYWSEKGKEETLREVLALLAEPGEERT